MNLRSEIAKLQANVTRVRSEHAAGVSALATNAALLMKRSGLEPDAWQADLLRSDWERALLLITRQGGKSTTVGALATHTAVFQGPSLVLLLSPSLRQSQELFRKVTDFYNAAGQPVPADAASALRLELANGSRIVALPGSEKTVRGFSGVDLLIIDEAARVLDELYYSIRPMLAVSGGRLIAMTTPFGKRGFFYDEWTSGRAWKRVRITAHECPRITPAFLEEERQTLGDYWFRQEYGCEFVDTVDAVFRTEDIERAFTSEVPLLFTNPVLPITEDPTIPRL